MVKPTSKTKAKTTSPIRGPLGREIRAEAKALGLSEREYLRLSIALSKALRESFGDSVGVSPRQLLQLVDSPLFGVLLKGLISTAVNTVNSKLDSNVDKEPQPSRESNGMNERQSLQGQPVTPSRTPQSRPTFQQPIAPWQQQQQQQPMPPMQPQPSPYPYPHGVDAFGNRQPYPPMSPGQVPRPDNTRPASPSNRNDNEPFNPSGWNRP